MDFDLDKYEIGFFQLGMPFHGADRIIDSLGYAINIRSGSVFGIDVRFSNFYSGGPRFDSALVKRRRRLPEPKFISPSAVLELYGSPVDQWDDDVEQNYQFLDGNVHVEFSWHKSANESLVLNYINTEIKTPH